MDGKEEKQIQAQCRNCPFWVCTREDGTRGQCRVEPPRIFQAVKVSQLAVDAGGSSVEQGFMSVFAQTSWDTFCGRHPVMQALFSGLDRFDAETVLKDGEEGRGN